MRRFPQCLVPSGVVVCVLLVVVGLGAWAATDSSEAQPGSMHNCPPAGKWSIAVWEGEGGTGAGDALGTCGAAMVAAAYSLDPETGAWSRWFAGKPEVSNLLALNDAQGVLALGSATGATATPTPPTPEPTGGAVEGPNYEMASQVTDLINQERVNHGLNSLSVNQALVSSAFDYTRFLITNKLFGHGLDGLQSQERAEKYGYVGLDVGEILTGGNSAESVLQAWINSPDHYHLMMMSEWDEIGVGCYRGLHTTGCAAEFGATTL